MLTEVVLETSTPTSLKIDDVSHDEILILKSVSNLSSVKVTQYIGDFAREGSYYQGRRAERRNPVFNFKLNPNYRLNIEVSDIREMLYRMFMEPQRDSDAVQVRLIDDRRPDRYFLGYTESIDTDAWVKDQVCQVSTMTTDAYLRSVDISTGAEPQGWFSKPLLYEGSADTGLQFAIEVLKITDRITVQNGIDLMVLTKDSFWMPGDTIFINTLKGERAVLHNGNDAMSALSAASEWIQIREQGNVLKVYGTNPSDGKAALVSYSYRASWWGI